MPTQRADERVNGGSFICRRNKLYATDERSHNASYCSNVNRFLAIPRHTEDILGLLYINSSLGNRRRYRRYRRRVVTIVLYHLVGTPRLFCCLATATSKRRASCCHLSSFCSISSISVQYRAR